MGPEVFLPEALAPAVDAKSLAGQWLTHEGMQAVIDGGVPGAETIITPKQLWRSEQRVGLQLERETRTARDGHLYAARHVRLESNVRLLVEVENWPSSGAASALPLAVQMGGESRSAWLEVVPEERAPDLKPLQQRTGSTVIALTLVLADEDLLRPGSAFSDSGASVRSVCADRPFGLGGWNGAENRPLPMRPTLPAGTTWFLDKPTSTGRSLGALDGWGYGEIVTGV